MINDLDEFIAAGALALKRALESRPADGLLAEFELRFWDPASGARHRQHFIDGRLIEWVRSDTSTAGSGSDLVCTVRELGALLGLPGTGPSLESFRLRRGDTGAVTRPPPFDATTTAALASTPMIPDASCVAGLHFADTPLGASDVTVDIVDGRPTFSIGAPANPDVAGSLRFDLTLRYMAGDMSLMDMLTGGSIGGDEDWPQWMLLAGVIESPEFQAAIDPVRGDFRLLANAVEMLSTPAYRTAMTALPDTGSA